MNVLLTGGAGFIGSHTAVELIEKGHSVVIVDNLVNSKPESVRRVEAITGTKIKLYIDDVADKAALEKIFEENKIDAVIHFAGLKAVGESVKLPVLYYRNNLDTTLTLLETMKKYGCTKLIFSSSATVYGDPVKVPITEDMHVGDCSRKYLKTPVTQTTSFPLFFSVTLTPSAHIRADFSLKTLTASRTTLCRISSR